MAKDIESLVIKLEADPEAFHGALDEARRRFDEWADHIEQRLAKLTQEKTKLVDG